MQILENGTYIFGFGEKKMTTSFLALRKSKMLPYSTDIGKWFQYSLRDGALSS